MLLESIFGSSTAAPPAPDDDFWYNSVGFGTGSGVKVDSDSALRALAVYACVRVLSETLAMLPLEVYRRLPDGGKERALDHPLYSLLHDQPNGYQTSFDFREQLQGHLALRGNAYAMIISDGRGVVNQLRPLHPDEVEVDLLTNGRLRYTVRDEQTSTKRMYTQDNILHIRGLSSRGVKGMNPIEIAREAVGLSLATERYGSKLFGNGARPGGIIEYPNKLNEEAAKRFKEAWQKAFGGVDNAHKVAVLEDGMKWQQVSMTSEDAQFLETRKYQVTEIARMFRVPPHLIGDLDKATFGNIEQQSLEFIIYTMHPWFKRWEQALKRDLILSDDRQEYFIEFNADGVLRGDAAARAAFYNSGITNGWLTRNEVRRKENLNPLDGLDEPLQQLNMSQAATPPDSSENQPTDPTNDDNKQSTLISDALDTVYSDVAARIASCEVRELDKLIKKAGGNLSAQKPKIETFYTNNRSYIQKTLGLASDVYAALVHPDGLDTESITETYLLDTALDLNRMEVAEFIETKRDNAVTELITLLIAKGHENGFTDATS